MIARHTRRRSYICSAMFLAVSSMAGCSKEPDAVASSDDASPSTGVVDSSTVFIAEGIDPTKEQIETMLAAKEALFKRLSSRLMETMAGEGPVAAIGVCKKEAPEIAKAVSDEYGLTIGRTGVRLRNSTNQAPSWSKQMVESKTDTPTFVTLSSGGAAALLPIKLQAQCLMCHGPKDQIVPDIQTQLAQLYPDDEATGFQEGELRGWFWIELPNS